MKSFSTQELNLGVLNCIGGAVMVIIGAKYLAIMVPVALRWLNLVLDIFVGALAVLLLTFAVTLSDITSPGALGVAMINLLNFNQDLASLIDSWTRMETSLGAISRLRDLENNTPQPIHNKHSNQWSFQRSLDFKQVSASYG
ncbi:unnamed protein product [Aspergillus oryzae]|uniref:Unnamed protein product n=2 Tax=Aspergillus oryzae TaxID=5062 RepID=A0AAN4YIL5_ASPOZ|nr:unnamed protein product [Aspergillus oryzae]GMF94796.1 unnamed protein product [Aspergillus oryzae]GMG01863.1 unnamed protein product [Aspergillus oryzae]GMG30737.1 unnamed protein product [Aspergillus oryzae]GMG43448.1 unnamed protein product [Aspergillus oryzae var. brunneus]